MEIKSIKVLNAAGHFSISYKYKFLEVNIGIRHAVWSKSSSCDSIFTLFELGNWARIFPISGSKHSIESFIRKNRSVQDIWKDGEFSKWLLSPLNQNSFQEFVFKAFEKRKRNGFVDHRQVRSTDRNLYFFKLKLLIFKRWCQVWMKSTAIKQRQWLNLLLVVFRYRLVDPILLWQCDDEIYDQ